MSRRSDGLLTGFMVYVVTALMFTIIFLDDSSEASCDECDWSGDWDECEIGTETRIANRTDPLWGNTYQVMETWQLWKCPECGEILKEEMTSEYRL